MAISQNLPQTGSDHFFRSLAIEWSSENGVHADRVVHKVTRKEMVAHTLTVYATDHIQGGTKDGTG